jgi:hypothetical protein
VFKELTMARISIEREIVITIVCRYIVSQVEKVLRFSGTCT